MRSTSLKRLLCAGLLVLAAQSAPAAATHPMDPLTADEILAAGNILLQGRAAQPGAIFQSIELREPPKAEVLAFRRGSAPSRSAMVFYRQNKQSFKSIVNLSLGTFSPPVLIPISDGQLGLTIQEVSDFAFVFNDPAFLAALAVRGIRTPTSCSRCSSRR